MPNQSLTAVPGLRVGHAQNHVARTGCTVIIGPFRGAVYVAGLATGTRELHVLEANHLVPAIDAVLLTGGSAFGLAAADGVVAWLEEHGRGFDTGVARVPIVPAAVLFDLGVGSAERRPDAGMGRAACEAATDQPVEEGAVGAGTGATVGKLLGPAGSMQSGVGSFAVNFGPFTVGALAVVNAFGDVLAANGSIIAGARHPAGQFANTAEVLRSASAAPQFRADNTTLAVVATDAPLDRSALHTLARQSANAMARRISPVFTQFDGDVIFALSTSLEARELSPAQRLGLASAAQFALEIAIERSVSGGIESGGTESA
jgi:L-aminopeptidase/D-esterase-like protein